MDRNKIAVIFFILFSLFAQAKNPSTFTIFLKNEPSGIDPVKSISGESNYLTATLFRGLTRYTDEGMLVFEDASRCRYIIDTDIRCFLRKDLKYSDGTPLTAQNYVDAFKRIITPGSAAYIYPLLLTIKNADKIIKGKMPLDSFGMKAVNDHEIQFLLEESDREFLEKLSNPLLVPYKNETATNGPYKVSKIVKTKKWYLEPNSFFSRGNPHRPVIEIIFVPSDSTAFDLYEKKVVDFLWRVSTDNDVKKRIDYKEFPMSRFDYIGFNMRQGKPLADKKLREMLSQSLKYDDFKIMFLTKSPGGCPPLGDHFLLENPKHCLQQKTLAEKVKWPPLIFKYSQLGGAEIEKYMVWLRDQWKQNLGAHVLLKSMEQKAFINELKVNPPDIFRKGIGLNRPSCLAGLEFFKSDHPENFTGFKDKKFDEMIRPLQTRKLSRIEQDALCAAASDYLFLENHVGIPVGRMYFPMLINPDFKGVKLNELNQLDLSELEYVGKK